MHRTVEQIYTQFISTLPPTEQLKLATKILNGLVEQSPVVVDDSDTWTDRDRLDLAAFSLQYATTVFSEDEAIFE